MKEQLIQLLFSVKNQKLLSQVDIHQYTSKIWNNATIISVNRNSKLVAFIAYYDNDNTKERAFLTMLAVCKEHRGKGYARRLINMSIDDLKQQDFKKYYLEVDEDNHSAISLYQGIGFEIESKEIDKILMVKKISD